ncbi:MAG: hypothetical protein LBI05_11070 [Planctomycetaceae bacterium]|jgi:hypothetical protein|nr:hypothetical protein [Planctomycetaceae bacterium]
MMNNSTLLLMTVFCSLFGGLVLVADTFVVADDSDTLYGKGVHAFFDGDYEKAITILSQVEDIKSVDPRPYYFLGLAYLRQKKTEKADQFFKKAAQLEYSGRALRDYGSSEALRRIQGEERLRLEKIRAEAKKNAQVRDQQYREARYGSENAAGREAIRQFGPKTTSEDLKVLQGMANNLGNNAFGVKPINPIGTEENVAIKQADPSPFGKIAEEEEEEPVEVEIVLPTRVQTPLGGGTTFTPNAPVAVQVEMKEIEWNGEMEEGDWKEGEEPSVTEAVLPTRVQAPLVTETTLPPNAPADVREEIENGQSRMGVAPAGLITNPPSVREAARGIGRSLGTLFSRKADSE